MSIAKAINNWQQTKEAYYKWLYQLTWTKKLFLSLVMATFTGVAAQMRILLPFTPVPITGQVLAVLLAGVVLGNIYGGLSMLLYFIIGCAGIPWFSGATSGLPIGPTTGYIIGFIPAALFIGLVTQRNYKTHKLLYLIGLMMTSVIIIYLFGSIHFALFMKTGLKDTLYMAILPFIPADMIKACFAAGFALICLPVRKMK